MINYTQKQTYWVVFSDGDHWTRWFCKKNWGHVHLIYKDEHNWIEINPRANKLVCEIMPYSAEQDVPKLVMRSDPNCHVLKVTMATPLEGRVWRRLGIMSCVAIVKYALGIKSLSFTPHQLFKTLFKLKKKHRQGVEEINLLW
jgi:hypothetical protein